LNYIVAIYLIIVGITGFTQAGARSDLLKGASRNPIEAVLPLIAQYQQPPRIGPFDDFRRHTAYMQRLSGIIEDLQLHPAEVIAEAAAPNHRRYACGRWIQ